jgi:glyoxylate carboligase
VELSEITGQNDLFILEFLMERLKNIVMEDEISNLLKKKEIRSQIEPLKTKKVWVLSDH